MIKQMAAAALALVMMFSLCACGSFISIFPGRSVDLSGTGIEGSPLFTYLGWSALADDGYQNDLPAAVSLRCVSGGESGCLSPMFGTEEITAVCAALSAMTVGAYADNPDAGQSQVIYTLTMADGSEYTASFDNGYLVTPGGYCTVTGLDAVTAIDFPVYSGDFDIFDLYFNDGMRVFADNFDTDTPISVSLSTNGSEAAVSRDAAVIRQIFELLAGAEIVVVENQPDQNIDLTQTREYTFTMSDGRTFSFDFAGSCLAVTADPDYGTVYYWLSGHESLWTISVSSEATADFEGGELYTLRSDFASVWNLLNPSEETDETDDGSDASAEADGDAILLDPETEETEDNLTILGIYVSYNIDGTEGYLTLSDDQAAEFLDEILSMEVAGDKLLDPQGDTMTVSVTLSDGSGPSIYFTGDSVQQTVGSNYACDSEAMSALRDTVLSYAAEGSYTAETGVGIE